MDWQVHTVTELHESRGMETSSPSLVWNESTVRCHQQNKPPWHCVYMLLLSHFPFQRVQQGKWQVPHLLLSHCVTGWDSTLGKVNVNIKVTQNDTQNQVFNGFYNVMAF